MIFHDIYDEALSKMVYSMIIPSLSLIVYSIMFHLEYPIYSPDIPSFIPYIYIYVPSYSMIP